MNQILAKAADILPGLLRNVIPVPSGPGYVFEIEGAELDALRDLADLLILMRDRPYEYTRQELARKTATIPPVDG